MIKLKKSIIFIVIFLLILFSTELILRLTGDLYIKKLYVHKYYNIKDQPKAINIVCLGESSTAGIWLPWQDSYPAQLQDLLRKKYPENNINVFVPPHVGQNTSQMENRIERHIEVYKPKILVIMAGYNNEWSLAESHISKFLELKNFENIKVRALVLLNNFRIFKMLRYAYLKFLVKEKSPHIEALDNMNYVWGGPELVRTPPKKFIYDFALSHREAFVELWRYDIKRIISAAKKNNIRVIIMTYQIDPTYLPAKEFIKLTQEEKVTLIRNDVTFQNLIDNGTIKDYLLWDNWHPNKKGYALIADNVFETIENNSELSRIVNSPESRKEYLARLELVDKAQDKGRLRFIIKITNIGGNSWEKASPALIKVGCRIYRENSEEKIALMELRQELPRNIIGKGDAFQSEFIIDSSSLKKETYIVKFDMVSEHRFWFEDKAGSSPVVEHIAN